MKASEAMAPVSPRRLQELERAIFTEKQGTVQEVAEVFSRDDLIRTIRAGRQSTRDAIAKLPDSAFAAQPANEAGESEWSVGEIVGHITESMLWLEFALARLAGRDPDAPADLPGIRVGDRAESLAMLDAADRLLERNLATVDRLSDDPRMEIDGLGDLGVRGLLLLHAMHEWEHAGQAAGLGAD